MEIDTQLLIELRIDPTKNIIFLGEGSELSPEMITTFRNGYYYLTNYGDSENPITLIINTLGGFDLDAWMIYDLIQTSGKEVNVVVMTNCSSSGTLILQSAKTRYITPHSRIMIHDGKDSWNFEKAWKKDQKISLKNKFKHYDQIDDAYNHILLSKIQQNHPEYTIQQFESLLQHDTFFFGQEIIDFGLADKIIYNLTEIIK